MQQLPPDANHAQSRSEGGKHLLLELTDMRPGGEHDDVGSNANCDQLG